MAKKCPWQSLDMIEQYLIINPKVPMTFLVIFRGQEPFTIAGHQKTNWHFEEAFEYVKSEIINRI